ncbi:unnamed protein product, partial [marine sediment metagenome]
DLHAKCLLASLAGFVLPNMALAAQIATVRRHGKIVSFAIIEVMTTPTADTPIE